MCPGETQQEADEIHKRGDWEVFSEVSRVWGAYKHAVKHSKASHCGEPSPLLHLKRPLEGASGSGSRRRWLGLSHWREPLSRAAEGCGWRSPTQPPWVKECSDGQPVRQQGGSAGNKLPGFYLSPAGLSCWPNPTENEEQGNPARAIRKGQACRRALAMVEMEESVVSANREASACSIHIPSAENPLSLIFHASVLCWHPPWRSLRLHA